MTLILSLANQHVTLQLSDRRLTTPDSAVQPLTLITEDANKAGAICCADARMAYAFSGLAFTGTSERRTFDTRTWLMAALLESASKDSMIEALIEQFKELASHEYATNKHILAMPKRDRRLSVMLSGFWNTTAGCIPAGWIITNFQQNFDLGTGAPDAHEPWDKFKSWSWHQTVPPAGLYYHVERLGQWKGASNEILAHLINRVRDNIPTDALLGSALKVMHMASESEKTLGSVGKQVSVVIVPVDISQPIRFVAESNVVTNDIFQPDILMATSPNHRRWLTLQIAKRVNGNSSNPALVPRVHRKAPCPCGSGLTYEKCHRMFRCDIPRRWQRPEEYYLQIETRYG